MRIKYEYAGTNATKTHLTVYVEIVTGSAKVVKSIHIPWSELTDTKILSCVDDELRRELKARWSSYSDCVFDLFNED
uniref:Uncharacterized protein n=1 Tax=uncultured prokaryote TaxID=198431 RepID=A0A0H5Q6E7_9ZZZZ|nr:hypothetical protein [uncultured prokaryote]